VKGDWQVRDGRITIERHGRYLLSLLVTDGRTSDAAISARMPVVRSGSGIVFRYANPFNYWMVRAVRGVASWQLLKVVDGKTAFVGNTGFSPTGDGTVVGVATRADGAIAISFNGKVQSSFTDHDLADKRGVGVGAVGGGSSGAVFTEFTVTPQIPASSSNAAPTSQAKR
jgi:hypothetical protein